MKELTKLKALTCTAYGVAFVATTVGIIHAHFTVWQIFPIVSVAFLCFAVGMSTGLLLSLRHSKKPPRTYDKELLAFQTMLSNRVTPGGWMLHSKLDERWNASGTSEHVGGFKMPKEAKAKIEEFEQLYGEKPKDLEYGYMKD